MNCSKKKPFVWALTYEYLDFDGTWAPAVEYHNKATATESMEELLGELHNDSGAIRNIVGPFPLYRGDT